MADKFATRNAALDSPASSAFAVTPDNDNDMASYTRGIYVGGAGNLKVDMADGTTVTFTAIAVGVIHPIRARRVYATGTTATLIIGLF
jgi:hypothetical protein